MNKFFPGLLIFLAASVAVFSCAKWKDPAPVNDPRLTNPYCNDPNAVNYNWNFPGKPDNTTCFYPTDLFAGDYVFVDSVYLTSTFTYLMAQTETLHVSKVSQTQLSVMGLCANGNTIHLTADKSYNATIDSVVGDSVTARGQLLCRNADTVNGTITKDRLVDSVLHINLQVISDTGITTHIGNAKRI